MSESFASLIPRAVSADDALEVAEESPYFPVATHKFIVLSVCTFGMYDIYWFFQNWRRIQERTRGSLSPFWRAVFAPFWAFSLFRHIHDDARRAGVEPGWRAGLLGVLYFVLTALWRLPDPWWLVCMLAFLTILPVLRTTQRLNAGRQAREWRNTDYSIVNVLTIIVGGALFLMALIGTLLPAEAGL